jgi:hypothetical protein
MNTQEKLFVILTKITKKELCKKLQMTYPTLKTKLADINKLNVGDIKKIDEIYAQI